MPAQRNSVPWAEVELPGNSSPQYRIPQEQDIRSSDHQSVLLYRLTSANHEVYTDWNFLDKPPQDLPDSGREFEHSQFEPQNLCPVPTPATPDHMDPSTEHTIDYRCNDNCEGMFLYVYPTKTSLPKLIVFYSGPHLCSTEDILLPIFCNDSFCFDSFDNRTAFNRHYWYDHCTEEARANPLLDCPSPYCVRFGPKGFRRKDNLTQHRRLCHGEYIPKRMSYARVRQNVSSQTSARPVIGGRVRRRG